MLRRDDVLTAAHEAKRLYCPALVDAATQAFFANLGASRCPSSDAIDAAMVAARLKLQDGLFKREVIHQLVDESPDADRLDAIRLSFARLVPELMSPPLPITSELHPTRLALAAMLGAGLGVLIGGPIGMYLLDARDTGLLVGAPLGAFITTWMIEIASRNKAVSNMLIGTLGVATAAEAWTFLSINPFAAIWRRLSGRSLIVRIAIYVSLCALLLFTRRQSTYNRAVFEQAIRKVIEQWVHCALIVLAVLAERQIDNVNASSDTQPFAELGQMIVELYSTTADRLPGAAEDVIAAARDAGFEGLDGTAAFRNKDDRPGHAPQTWNEAMREQYDVFGHIEIGDVVCIEQEPVIFRGDVQKRGLVRKQRGQ